MTIEERKQEIRFRADLIVNAYCRMLDKLEQNESKAPAVEEPIDERYHLVALRNGETVNIVDAILDSIDQDFIPDDEWLDGDPIGGYINIYVKR